MSKLWMVCGAILLASSLQASTVAYDSTQQTTDGAAPIEFVGPLYASFSTGATSGALSNLELLLGLGEAPDGLITVGLYSDSGTTPGSLISDLGAFDDSILTSGPDLFTVALTANPELSAGTRYWIGLSSSGTLAGWDWTSDTSGTGVDGEYYSDRFGTYPNDGDRAYQMEVEVTASSAPEPSTFFFGASMLAALAALRRRATRLLQR